MTPTSKKRPHVAKRAVDQLHRVRRLWSLTWGMFIFLFIVCLYQVVRTESLPPRPISLIPCLVLVLFAYLYRTLWRVMEEYHRLVHLERSARTGTFSSWAAHQLRSPLAMIRAQAQLLTETPPRSPEVARAGKLIVRRVDTISDITAHFLALAHPLELETEPVDLDVVLASVIETLEDEAPPTPRFTVRGRFAPVLGQTTLLRECLRNILQNAAESIHGDGEIYIRSTPHSQRLHLAITDNGCGIPPHQVKNITDAGFTTRREGTGLGLAITRTIIDMHKGQLAIQSREGVGTTVKITLPMATSS